MKEDKNKYFTITEAEEVRIFFKIGLFSFPVALLVTVYKWGHALVPPYQVFVGGWLLAWLLFFVIWYYGHEIEGTRIVNKKWSLQILLKRMIIATMVIGGGLFIASLF